MNIRFLMGFDLSPKIQEAIRVALAFVTVYYIALSAAWMNPYWAGFAVTMVSLAGSGQSLHKGLMRVAGTTMGCSMALVISSLAPQERWLFLFLGVTWVVFTCYKMMVDQERTYMWNVAGWTCMLIAMAGPPSSDAAFQHALFRTVETMMGVVVYTLYCIFLWPVDNRGLVRKASQEVLNTQSKLLKACRDSFMGEENSPDTPALRKQQVQQLGQMVQALATESPGSYRVNEQRETWGQLHGQCDSLMQVMERLAMDLPQLSELDLQAMFPGLPEYFDEIERRFKLIEQALVNDHSCSDTARRDLSLSASAMGPATSLQRAALALTKKDLETVEALSHSILALVNDLAADASGPSSVDHHSSQPGTADRWTPPVVDIDHIKQALFAGFAVVAGYLIWIYLDPPGHNGWYSTAAPLGMMLAGTPQMKMTSLVMPIGLTGALCIAAYVFILPQLTSFIGLGSLLFVMIFISCYFFTGLAKTACLISIINNISIQNQQTYDFAGLANGLLFMIGFFLFVYALSYLLSTPRPEKVIPNLMRRYFRSAEYQIARVHHPAKPSDSAWLDRWKLAFYRYEMKTLPSKIATWAHFIDHKLFPANTEENIQGLVASLQFLVSRMEALVNAGVSVRSHTLAVHVQQELTPWMARIQAAYGTWAMEPGAEAKKAVEFQQQLTDVLDTLQQHLEDSGRALGATALTETDKENLLRLLGGMQGLTEASVAYSGAAANIDWAHWREERFT